MLSFYHSTIIEENICNCTCTRAEQWQVNRRVNNNYVIINIIIIIIIIIQLDEAWTSFDQETY